MEVDTTAAAGADASNGAAGNGASSEGDVNKGGAGADELVPKSLYENQKIRAEKAEAALKARGDAPGYDPEAVVKTAEEAAKRTYDQQYINEQGFPDEIKAEIEKVAKVQGISLRQAAQDPYIQHQVQEHKRAERVRQASPDAGSGGKGGYVFDADNPPDVDVSTPEGQEAIDKWEKELERRRSK